jgi:hypothetical protein
MDDHGAANVNNLIVMSGSTVGSTMSSSNFLAILDGNQEERMERDGQIVGIPTTLQRVKMHQHTTLQHVMMHHHHPYKIVPSFSP